MRELSEARGGSKHPTLFLPSAHLLAGSWLLTPPADLGAASLSTLPGGLGPREAAGWLLGLEERGQTGMVMAGTRALVGVTVLLGASSKEGKAEGPQLRHSQSSSSPLNIWRISVADPQTPLCPSVPHPSSLEPPQGTHLGGVRPLVGLIREAFPLLPGGDAAGPGCGGQAAAVGGRTGCDLGRLHAGPPQRLCRVTRLHLLVRDGHQGVGGLEKGCRGVAESPGLLSATPPAPPHVPLQPLPCSPAGNRSSGGAGRPGCAAAAPRCGSSHPAAPVHPGTSPGRCCSGLNPKQKGLRRAGGGGWQGKKQPQSRLLSPPRHHLCPTRTQAGAAASLQVAEGAAGDWAVAGEAQQR